MSEKEASAEEQRQAEALAAELDGRDAQRLVPTDAAETAALLKASQAGLSLGQAQQKAVLDRVLGPEPQAAGRLGLKHLLPLGAALAAVLLLILVFTGKTPGPETASLLPRPGQPLLQAQAAATAGDMGPLRTEMHHYRRDLYAALALRYRGQP